MRARVKYLAAFCVTSLLMFATLATAATPDLRLVTAAAEQDKMALRALLKEGVDVNASRSDGVTALLWAAHWNDLETVDLLLRAGANVNAADDYGVTALARAAENASTAVIGRLLAAGANPNAAQKSGLTPLMTAARTGNVQVVKALLARGADVNAATSETKATALMWAVAGPHPDITSVLIEGGADAHKSTAKGFTPLLIAARNGDIEMARTLIAAGVNVNEPGADGTHVLPFAIINGHRDFAVFVLEQGADPNGDIDGVRALHAAAGPVTMWLGDWQRRHGDSGLYQPGPGSRGRLSLSHRLELVNALLARGADLNARMTSSAMIMNYIGYPKKGAFEPFACGTGDLRGATPLWVAAYAANFPGDQIRGAGANAADPAEVEDTNRGALSTQILTALMSAGADQRLTTDDGTTPLMVAAGLGRSTYTPRQPRGRRSPGAEGAVRALLEAGGDINAVNEASFTALHGAAYRGLDEVVQILVDHGASINARDFRGRTPYRLAEGSKQSFQFQSWPETAEFLKQLGADTRLGVPGTVQERARDLVTAAAQQQ